MVYERRQIGYYVGGALLLGALTLTGVSLLGGVPEGQIFRSILATLFFLIVLVFGSLKIRVEETSVQLSFGIGLIRRSIPMDRIVSADPVRNRWWYGFGIRLTPRGWLWNIQGLDAVELTYTNGEHFRIGTADPEGLAGAIRRGLSQ